MLLKTGIISIVDAEFLTKIQGIVMVLSGIRLALTRNQGSTFAFICYMFQAFTVENAYLVSKGESGSDHKRSVAINFLKLVTIGLTCLLMHSKQRPYNHLRVDLSLNWIAPTEES